VNGEDWKHEPGDVLRAPPHSLHVLPPSSSTPPPNSCPPSSSVRTLTTSTSGTSGPNFSKPRTILTRYSEAVSPPAPHLSAPVSSAFCLALFVGHRLFHRGRQDRRPQEGFRKALFPLDRIRQVSSFPLCSLPPASFSSPAHVNRPFPPQVL
jgi:hypothetical protein